MTDLFGHMKTFAVGDDAWIFIGEHGGELSQGKVIAVIELPGYSFPHYVIELETHLDPLLEIRNGGLGIFHENVFEKDDDALSAADGAKP